MAISEKQAAAGSPEAASAPVKEKKALTAQEREALRKKREEARLRREQARKDREASGFGTVTINAIPYAQVTLDGKAVGRTPVTRKVSAGRGHTVVLKYEKKRYRTRFKVDKDKRKTVFHRFK